MFFLYRFIDFEITIKEVMKIMSDYFDRFICRSVEVFFVVVLVLGIGFILVFLINFSYIIVCVSGISFLV